MFTLIAQNKYGQQLELTHNDAYVIKSIDGLDPPDAVINTTKNANADGSVFNSSHVDNRTITITLAINGPAEENRINLYKYFKSKYPVRLYYKNDTRDIYIDGYVQHMPIGFFDKKQIAQITIFCPNPFFNGADDQITDFSSVKALFEFPFFVDMPGGEIEFGEILIEQEKNIINNGDVETGALFVLRAKGALSNPIIYNVETNEFFALNISLVKGDEVYINTRKKQKSVVKISNGVTTNVIGNLESGSTWFQLNPGDNIFTTTASTSPENLEAYCIIINQFEGV